MNLAQRVLYLITGNRSLLKDTNGWLVRHFGGVQVHSGVDVNETSAMQNTAVFACVRILSDTVASLPLPVFRRLEPQGKSKDYSSALYMLLHDRPNSEQTSFQWRKTGIAHQLLWGDWFSEIEYNNSGMPVALWPIPPWLVEVRRAKSGGVYYDVRLPDQSKRTLASWQMLHIRDLSTDGLRGKSRIRYGAEAIGLSIAAEEFGARFYGEGANVGGIIEHPGRLKDTALDNFKASIKESYVGLGKAHRLMVLEEGSKYHRVGIPPNEAQFLELRKFQVAEIGRLFGISQLHKIGDLDKATFSNIEHQSIEFVVDTIRPLLVNIEQELNYKLFDGKPQFAEFVIDGLLRGDTKSRNEAYAIMRQNGIISANEWRAFENMNPLPDDVGNLYLVPMNMIPADQARMPVLKEPEPEEEPPPEENSERSLEKRTREQRDRQALLRARVAKSHEHIFRDAAQKVLTREKTHITKALEKHLGDRSLSSFDDWLEDFYREFQPFVAQTMRPAITALALAVRTLAAQEVNGDEIEVQRDIDDYVERQAQAHTIRSKAILKQLINKADTEGLDLTEVVTERLDEWAVKRANQIASDNAVAVASLVAKAVFAGAGFMYLRWVAIGAESCELCQELDGKIVGIDQPFVAKDDLLEAEGQSGYRVNKPTLTPPLHRACVCTIVAE